MPPMPPVTGSLSHYALGRTPYRRMGDSVEGMRPFHEPPFGEPPRRPADAGMAPWLQERLFTQRIVAIRGPVTSASASDAVSILLTLDTMGSDPVQLHLGASDGE